MSEGYVIFIAACLGFAVYQLLWTRLHGRSLDRHAEEMRRIYAEDAEKRKAIYAKWRR